MKRSRKPTSTRNIVSENSSAVSASGIKTYFKRAPKSFAIVKTVPVAKPSEDAKQFYVDILKEKLQRVRQTDNEKIPHTSHESIDDEDQVTERGSIDNVNNQEEKADEEMLPVESGCGDGNTVECTDCVAKSQEINNWKSKYELEVAHRKEVKKLYLTSTVSFSELYSKYNDLLKTTAALPKSADATASSSDDIFTSNEVKYLQCMSLEKKYDCSFILSALKFAYKSDLSIFATRTLFGTAERIQIDFNGERVQHPAKDPMTPSKVARMKTLFIERISKCEITSTDYTERMNDAYVNKLFAAGIRNISKKST